MPWPATCGTRPTSNAPSGTAVDTYGGIDILVPNSGGPPPARADEIDAERVQDAVDLLLLPVVRLVTLALPHLLRSDQGRIVLISSLAVREPTPHLALTNAVRPASSAT